MGERYMMRVFTAGMAIERKRSGRTVVDDVVATMLRAWIGEKRGCRGVRAKAQGVVEVRLVVGDAEVRSPVRISGRGSGAEYEGIAAVDDAHRASAASRFCHPLAGIGDMIGTLDCVGQIGTINVMISTIAGIVAKWSARCTGGAGSTGGGRSTEGNSGAGRTGGIRRDGSACGTA